MDTDALREQLSNLHAELNQVSRVDPASSRLLSELMRDIQRLLDTQDAEAAGSAGSLPERLEKIAVRFEAAHPTLAASSRRLVDLFGNIGL